MSDNISAAPASFYPKSMIPYDPAKKRIAIDMDEVMADATQQYLDYYNAEFNQNLCKKDLKIGTKVYENVPAEHRFRLRSYVFRIGFFSHLKPLPDSQEVIRVLNERYEVFIATAAMEVPNSFQEKYAWLSHHFSFLDPMRFVFCGHKYMLATDYLIDDNPKHFELFQGQGLLFSANHNLLETGYERVGGWLELAQKLL
ncbi:MAG: hypothetical protein R2880_17850 [Deinococcales bacterium]